MTAKKTIFALAVLLLFALSPKVPVAYPYAEAAEQPVNAPSGGPTLLAGDGFIIWIQSLEWGRGYDGSEYLIANVWVHNTTEYELEISFEDVKLNGVEFISDGIRNCGTGDYPWSFEVWSEDGYTAAQREALYAPRTLSASLEVYEGENWGLLMTQKISVDLESLL